GCSAAAEGCQAAGPTRGSGGPARAVPGCGGVMRPGCAPDGAGVRGRRLPVLIRNDMARRTRSHRTSRRPSWNDSEAIQAAYSYLFVIGSFAALSADAYHLAFFRGA